ncbi:hypothetical protein PoB_001267800 [Plakobranchus ocellatus]|uniref:Uncharacterized protein n=1 Tax=Plakobranchus ocellatus TaxID=259542 RepID=A0AAV3YV01_9GAST|nr:hypothetical protein PoB_001267800 [Plakobranchus ocellatus]
MDQLLTQGKRRASVTCLCNKPNSPPTKDSKTQKGNPPIRLGAADPSPSALNIDHRSLPDSRKLVKQGRSMPQNTTEKILEEARTYIKAAIRTL